MIYLYSKEEKQFHIDLPAKIQIVDTRPLATGRGWDVITKLDGTLTLRDSNETIPYLFWEGEVSKSTSSQKGFVVGAKESLGFFREKLKFLGLSERELNDFSDFWQEHYGFAPYYFVRFLSQDEIEKRAPLSVTPKPDTIIRISVVIAPLKQPFKAPLQRLLRGPARAGDTLVEWGVIPN